MINILKNIAWIVSFLMTIYALHFIIISVFSFIPLKKKQKFEPKHKFAAIIAARNEELVIGNLIESLKLQHYPQELFDIIVIPNNCTDNTREVSIQNGAKVFDCKGPIKSKGDALKEFFHYILTENNTYDAFCIFDADNLVHNNYLSEMNNAMCNGSTIAQGYRDSKNPQDTIISSCYSIYYYIVNRFHNHARGKLNISAMVNGSGFMVSKEIIEKLDGWHTKTMTEDIEFTIQCVLNGDKVDWVPEAIIFDEQPLTFADSWKQRKRWSTGLIQCMDMYLIKLIKNLFVQKKFSNFDMIMFFLAPVVQVLYFISILTTILLNVMYIKYDYFPQTDIFYKLFLSVDYSYFATFAAALIAVLLEKKHKMTKGVLTFWFFMISWMPINILCMVKKQTEWTQIKHTRVIKIDQVSYEDM